MGQTHDQMSVQNKKKYNYLNLCKNNYLSKIFNAKQYVISNYNSPNLNDFFEPYTATQIESNSLSSPFKNYQLELLTMIENKGWTRFNKQSAEERKSNKFPGSTNKSIEFTGYFNDILLTILRDWGHSDIIEWKLTDNNIFYPYKIYRIQTNTKNCSSYDTLFSSTSDKPFYILKLNHSKQVNLQIYDLFQLTKSDEKLKKNGGIISQCSYELQIPMDTSSSTRMNIYKCGDQYILIMNIEKTKICVYSLNHGIYKINIPQKSYINGTSSACYGIRQDTHNDNIFHMFECNDFWEYNIFKLKLDLTENVWKYELTEIFRFNLKDLGIKQSLELFSLCGNGQYGLCYIEKSRLPVAHRYRFCPMSNEELKKIEESEPESQVWIIDLSNGECVWTKEMRLCQKNINNGYKDKKYVIFGEDEMIIFEPMSDEMIDLCLKYLMEYTVIDDVNVCEMIMSYLGGFKIDFHERKVQSRHTYFDKFKISLSDKYNRITCHQSNLRAVFFSYDLK